MLAESKRLPFCLQWAGLACSDKGDGAHFCVPAAAIVSNHISYMDIIVHLAHSFPSFVARGNTQDMPLIGLIRWAAMPCWDPGLGAAPAVLACACTNYTAMPCRGTVCVLQSPPAVHLCQPGVQEGPGPCRGDAFALCAVPWIAVL